jgi:hypothetical protein
VEKLSEQMGSRLILQAEFDVAAWSAPHSNALDCSRTALDLTLWKKSRPI